MLIRQKRIRKIDPYTRSIPNGDHVIVATVSPNPDSLKKVGFSDTLADGEVVLPVAIGKVSMFNAEGQWIKHEDQPKETAYRTVEWHWTEWHGRYDRVERSDFRDVPYQRYPRSFVAPPSVELTLATDTDGNRIVRTGVIKNWRSKKADVVHAVNLLLELFGECSFYDADMKQLIAAPVKRLNWRLLPPGQRPFASLKKELQAILSSVKDGKRPFGEHRLELINDYKPDFAAVGTGGFQGYIVLGFKERNLYVLESLLYGNATYLFDERWEDLSKKTKAEILTGNLQKDRIIHHKAWDGEIAAALKGSVKR